MIPESSVKAINASFDYIYHTFVNGFDIFSLVIAVIVALLVGRILAWIMRRLVLVIGRHADRSKSLQSANRLRRFETYLVLSIAIIRSLLFLLALYIWWLMIHPNGQPTAIIGASALAVIIVSSSIGPLLRDIASGSAMMAEQWFGVGDLIKIEPFGDMQGVVERVTLRSTRIRGLNGEVIWVNNQNIQAVRLTPRGTRMIALELFVTDKEVGEELVELTNNRLPSGPLLLVTPLQVESDVKVGENLWHITALGETAPGREWLLEKSAVDLIRSLDSERDTPVIEHGPLARYADEEAEKRFKRTIYNARKRPIAPRRRRTRK